MKNIILYFLIIVLLACDKVKLESVKNNDKEIIRVFSKMGEHHNSGLDYLFSKLNHTKKNRLTYSRTSLLEEIQLKEVNKIVDDYFVSTFSLPSNDIIPYFKDSIVVNPECTKEEFFQYFIDSISFVPSTKLTEALNSIFKIIESGYVVLNISNSRYDAIQSTYFDQLKNDTEKAILVAACSVAEASSVYWNENYELILSRVNGINISSRVSAVDPWKVISADCRGAIIGVARGGIMGAVSGTVIPGIGTVSGATAGGLWGMGKGMVVSSGASAIWQHVKGWWE